MPQYFPKPFYGAWFLVSLAASLYGGGIDFTDLKGTNGGQTVLNFLTLPVSAGQLSRSIAAYPCAIDATDIPFAASGTAFLDQYTFAISHLEWLMGLRKEYVGGSFPLLDQGTLSVYSQVFTLGNFSYARDIDEFDTDPTALELALGVSYARMLFYQKISAGITASYIESRLAGDNGRAFNAAVDCMFRPALWFSAHGFARNLGTNIMYNDVAEPQPLQAGLSLQVSPFALRDTVRESFDISVAVGAQKTIDAPLQIGAGLDISPVKHFSIRFGYDYFYGHTPSPVGLSAGIGLNVKQYGVDAGWKYQSEDFGSVWALTVRYTTEEIRPKSAQEFYAVAERFYRKEKYKPSILYAKKALRINPEMWKAHALIAKSISEMHQKKGTEIAIIYTGNTQGNFLPLITDGISMGGLARQAAVINTIRHDYPTTICLDAGNMITGQSPVIKAQFADTYYELCDYDAVGVGKGELAFGFKKFCKKVKNSSTEYVCTNCANTIGNCFVDTKIISAGKYKIAVLSAVPAAQSGQKGKKESLFEQTMELTRQTQSLAISQCNLRILIVNDSWDIIQQYARNIPLVDVILCGSLPQKFDTPMKIGNTPILSPGENGKYVGAFEVRFDKNNKMLSYNNRLFALRGDVLPNPDIDLLANQITLKSDFDQYGFSAETLKKSKTDGVFAFVSDRRGNPHIYLKVMKNKTEFPLTYGDIRCSSPRISFKTGKIIYLAEHDTLPRKALMSMNINGAQSREIFMSGSISEAVFSADEQWIYTAISTKKGKPTDIYRVPVFGGEQQPVIAWKDGAEQDMTFSSDNINMVFTSDREGRKQLYISDIEGNTPVQLTDDPSNNYAPRFSPLDKYIAFLSEKNNFNNKRDIWVHEMSTGKKIRVTNNANVRDFCWLDDKGTLVYSSGINSVDLNTINLFTAENNKLIITGNPKEYSETNPSVIVFHEQKHILYTREYTNGEKKLYLVNADGTEDLQASLDTGNCWYE